MKGIILTTLFGALVLVFVGCNKSSERVSGDSPANSNSAQSSDGVQPRTAALASTSVSQTGSDCVEGAKRCEGEAAAQWMGDEETQYINYSCRNPEAPQSVLKISLVRRAELDVANLHKFRYEGGASQRLWGAFVFNPPQYGQKSDGSYHLRGERQFAAPNEADVTLELKPVGNRMKYFVEAWRSGSSSTDDILFLEEGACSKVANKTGVWGVNP